MTVDRNPTAGTVSHTHATRVLRQRSKYRVSDSVRQARDDLAQMMADGCPSISEAARRMRIPQNRCDQHWQAIRSGLDEKSWVPDGGRWSV